MSEVRESAKYEQTISNLASNLMEWRGQNEETADQFARRMVGILRMDAKDWLVPQLKMKK